MAKTKPSIDTARLRKKISLAVKDKADLSKLKPNSLNQIGKTLIDEMLDRIASGISPITGKRFPGYKNPANYPGGRKPNRPVNLFLSGQFLSSLTYRIKTGKIPGITILFKNQTAEKKEQGHRDGANGQLKRPIIPRGNESFTDGILASVRQVFRKVIDKDLK